MQSNKFSSMQRSRRHEPRDEDSNDRSGEFDNSTNEMSRSEVKSTRSISPIRKNDTPSDYSSILKPIMLLDIDERGIIKINKSALEYIQGLNTKIAVLSVVGPYRTGKSFLLNRFAGFQKGFALGSSTNPCTRGMWLWGKPIRLSENLHLLLLDTEGLGSYTRDENIDAKLFTLTALMSSTMVYNVMNAIDERAIEGLSFVANLSKYLSSEHLMDQEENVAAYFPDLVWSVRDFALELVGKDKTPVTPKEYMESSLAIRQGDTEEVITKNRVRRAITEYFKKRECYTLVRPVNDEAELREMEKQPYEKIRLAFREQAEDMITSVLKGLRPKVIKGVAVEGKVYTELILNFVDALNNQALPSIPATWERIIERELQSTLNRAVDFYVRNMRSETEGKLPMNEDALQKLKSDISKKSEEILAQYKYSDVKLNVAKERYFKRVEEFNSALDIENSKKSKEFCTVFAQKLLEKLDKDLKAGKYKHISHFTREFHLYRKTYLEESRGPAKHEIFSFLFVENFLRLIENFHTSVCNDWDKEKSELEKELSISTGRVEALNMLLKQEKESAQKLLTEQKSRSEEQREHYQKKVLELNDQLEDKLTEANRWRQKLESDNENLRSIIEVMKMDRTALASEGDSKKKSKKADKENIPTKDDMLMFRQDMKSQLDFMTDAMKTLLIEVKKDNNGKLDLQLQYEKDKEITNMERLYQQQLMEAKSLSEETVDSLKQSFDSELKSLRDENRKLERSKENTVMALLEKEGKIKVMEEKMLSYVKENKIQIDHADMLCKISDQLLKLMRKLDRGDYDYK